MKRVRLTGHDDISRFRIKRGVCGVCGKRKQLVLGYERHPYVSFEATNPDVLKTLLDTKVYRMLTWRDLFAHTILGKAYKNDSGYFEENRGWLGIQCGCYAKFQRQLTHVTNGVQKKIERSLGKAEKEILREAKAAGYEGAI